MEEEEIDLSNTKWSPINELYIISITESIKENYPDADIEAELKEIGYTLDDLTNPERASLFMRKLNEKYPD
jgi:hypothetical protein